jgi:hypothetical protein
MRTMILSLLLTVAPSLAAAQSSAQPGPMQGLSAQGRVQAEATLQAARDQGLPEQPLIAVMLEGQAKGAAEAQILAAEQQAFARLDAAQDAIVAAGRTDPSDAAVTLGASLIAQGVTGAQLAALVTRNPSDAQLVASFDAVAALTAQGVPVTSALVQVGANGGLGIEQGAGTIGTTASAGTSVEASGAGSVGTLDVAGGTASTVSAGIR